MEEAIRFYESAIRKFPNFYRAYYNVGRAYVALNEFEKALPHLRKAVEIKPGDGTLYGLISYCYMNTGRYNIALDGYRMAILLQPNNRDWRLGKLNCLVSLRLNNEAVGYLYELLDQEPENRDFWMAQSNAFLSLEKTDLAAANLEILRQMGQANTSALILLADIYLNENLPSVAYPLYEEALESGQLATRQFFRISEVLLARGDYEKAGTLMSHSAVDGLSFSEEDELRLLNLRARLAMAGDDHDTAVDMLQSIVDRDPLNGQALLTLSDLHFAQEDDQRALYYAQNAAKLEAVELEAHLKAARILVRQRQFNEAARHLRSAQSIRPQEFVADYLRRIEQAAQQRG
jgi:tetratricopeptide (TPR) repeat protein